MAHTNVTIEQLPSNYLLEKLHMLEAELSYWKERANHFYNELNNIPEAIEQWGHVDFYDEKGNLIVTVIEKGGINPSLSESQNPDKD